MTGLVVVAGLMALASGLLKLFGKGRGIGGVPLLALLELLAGVAVPLYVLQDRPPQGHLSWILFLTLGLILVSSLLQVARVRALKRHREETESARLVTYVKYLSTRVKADGRSREERD
jgi:peptidoglycan/LPS O-acetylase OafA/YrhL